MISYDEDIIPSLLVVSLVDTASGGNPMGENIEYKRTQDFGCCQEEKTNVTLIVVICVAAVVVIGAVVTVIVVMNKKKTNLPKKPTVSCVCYKERRTWEASFRCTLPEA